MNVFEFQASDLAATDQLGAAFAQQLASGTVIALCGTLGAGKTRFVQAIAVSLGVPRTAVVSPTFVLVQEYPGRMPVYHFDAYRLADEDEFLELGVDEYFHSEGISLVEWADRVAGCLPREHLVVQIEVESQNARRFTIHGTSERFAPILDALRDQFASK